MIRKPNFMIVSGNGRNSGKTSFVEGVIKKNCHEHPITAIKVSPHFHPADRTDNTIESNERFNISIETDTEGNKDSSRMLRAGAIKVYYIEASDGQLEEALQILTEKVDLSGPVICESGGMRKYIDPSLLVLLNEIGRHELKSGYKALLPKADHLIVYDNGELNLKPEYVIFTGDRWELHSR